MTRAAWLLCLLLTPSTAAASGPRLLLLGHQQVERLEVRPGWSVSLGSDGTLAVWHGPFEHLVAWRSVGEGAGIVLRDTEVVVTGQGRRTRYALPRLEPIDSAPIRGSVTCRGANTSWSWSGTEVTLSSARGDLALPVEALPADDAICAATPSRVALVWSDDTAVRSLLAGDGIEARSAPLPQATVAWIGLSESALWARVEVDDEEQGRLLPLVGTPDTRVAHGHPWRSCDTYLDDGLPAPCQPLPPDVAPRVLRPTPLVPDRATWSDDGLLLEGPFGIATLSWFGAVPSVALRPRGAADEPVTALRLDRRTVSLDRVDMASCSTAAWALREHRAAGSTPRTWFGPVCGPRGSLITSTLDGQPVVVLGHRAAGRWMAWDQTGTLALDGSLPDSPGELEWLRFDADRVEVGFAPGGAAFGRPRAGTSWTPLPAAIDGAARRVSVAGDVIEIAATGGAPALRLMLLREGVVAWDAGSWFASDALLGRVGWQAGDGHVVMPRDRDGLGDYDPSVVARALSGD
jgi:hypothetical protein